MQLDTIGWIAENKTWLLSGIGLAIPVAVAGWLFSRRFTNRHQAQLSETDSPNLQAGGDIDLSIQMSSEPLIGAPAIGPMKKTMRCEFSSLYYIVGMHLPSTEQMYDSGPVKVILTTQPDAYCENLDRHRAARSLIGVNDMGTDDERLERELQELRKHRAERHAGGTFLVFKATGECSIDEKFICERGTFCVAIDAVQPGELEQRHEQLIAALLAASVVVIPGIVYFQEVSKASVFVDGTGRPIFSYNIRGQTPIVLSPAPATKEQIKTVGELVEKVSADSRMASVCRLLDRSFDVDEGQAHRFRFAWNSLEVFVNAYSSDYEKEFQEGLASSGVPKNRRNASHKPSLLEQYKMLVKVLSPADADSDIDIFRRAKELRNRYFHGEAVNESGLPVQEIQGLVRKLISLHVDRSSRSVAKQSGSADN